MPPDAVVPPAAALRGRPSALLDGVVARVHGAVADGARGVGPGRVAALVRAEAPLAGAAAVASAVDRVRQRVEGLGPLEPLLADPEVTEVMVNGPGREVWIERRGALLRQPIVLDAATVELVVERIVAPLGRRADRSSPTVDARLPDGSRVHVVVPPLAVDGPCITIRRFGARAVALGQLAPPGVAALLAWAVRRRANVLATGGTGAGKTTLLNALAGSVPAGERIVTIEDAAELRLPHPHVVRLEAQPARPGVPAVTIRELVRNALRMRPDRVVIGEVRGPEALDLVLAMNTGHEGALSTLHANGPSDGLARLEALALTAGLELPLEAVRQHVAVAVDLVVHVARRPDGSRAVVAVAEVVPRDEHAAAGAAGGRPLGLRSLAGPAGLHTLPTRACRAEGPVADPAWVEVGP